MNYKNILKELSDFLIIHKDKYNQEVLNFYPQSLLSYEEEWIATFNDNSYNEIFHSPNKLKETESEGLNKYLRTIKELSNIKYISLDNDHELPKSAFLKIKDKKKHELSILHNTFQSLNQVHKINNIIDLGGGVGNLSRTFCNYSNVNATCIEANPELIDSGKKYLKKHPLKNGSIHFLEGYFPKIKSLDQVLNQKKSLMLGLHTCGGLAVELILSHIKSENPMLLSFGCCYHKLNIETQINLSSAAKENPLTFSIHALTLATRGHNNIDFKEYDYSRKMKSYRYSLHLFILEELKVNEFISVGDGNKAAYNGQFSEYAFSKLLELYEKKIIPQKEFEDISKERLTIFFNRTSTKDKVSKMLAANIIRWQLGRVIEIYILLDRAIFLQEQGYSVSFDQYFDEKLSPRNIGILSIK